MILTNIHVIEEIKKLNPETLNRNNAGDFWEIYNSYLLIGARTTGNSVVPGKLDFEGKYRFFDAENTGKATVAHGLFPRAVTSREDAVIHVLCEAVEDILISPNEEMAQELNVIPFRLCILCPLDGSIGVKRILETDDLETLPELERKLCRYLRLMRSVSLAVPNRDIWKSILSLQ